MTRLTSGRVPASARVINASVLRAWLDLACRTGEMTRPLVDALNVFPVPDADTGTNVLLTVRAARDALGILPSSADLAQVTRAAADGAVRGARGNSGLLVSQVLAALADVSAEAPDPAALRPIELVRAYECMAETTWDAVSRPVPGTLLTVARDAAVAARRALEEAGPYSPATVSAICAAAAFGAQESVVETAGLGHGPVDAGGAALMLMLTGLSDTVDREGEGERRSSGERDADRTGAAASDTAGAGSSDSPDSVAPGEAPCTEVAHQMLVDLLASAPHGARVPDGGSRTASGEFEVMYLLEATAVQAGALREELERIGDSVGVVGTPDALGVGLYQVHVHTDTPRAALPRVGRARQVCIHHLHTTALAVTAGWGTDEPPLPGLGALEGSHVVSFERLASRRRTHRPSGEQGRSTDSPRPPLPARSEPGVGVIACTRAPGLIEQLARTGAVVVLDPERDGIVRAAVDIGLGQVLVLPCDVDSAARAHEAARFLTARATASRVRGAAQAGPGPESAIQLLVCDTDDEARVLAAAVAVAGHDGNLTGLVATASRAAAGLRTLAFDDPLAEADVVADALDAALRPEDELVTVILGRDAVPDVGALAAEAAARYAERVHGVHDAIEVVVHAGGQEHPDVLLALE